MTNAEQQGTILTVLIVIVQLHGAIHNLTKGGYRVYIIDNQSRQAVYEQIVEQTERFILTGILTADQPMPSVRSLSVELSVNPNTIQKAYTDLDRRGLIYSVPGKGSFVSADAKKTISDEKMKKLAEIEAAAFECALAGIDKTLIYKAVDNGYGRNGGSSE